ncbi:protein Mo25-like isoform X2 [Glycine soja]|uniref:protein Mo25 isoform X3 n=1 Tax=Glycine max TaxID=3847 RepID=UPI0003DEC338|nr:protein Mo25 isoform X3 [Glycine max]XP_028217864.1 protein Mo25-like isoform X2 [Glycine soja]|eukprot:XP_006604607.1 protein Mo25 isoform X3 [Glycine max]
MMRTLCSRFFDVYEKLLTSPNYVTRRQSLKLISEFLLESPNSQIMKRHLKSSLLESHDDIVEDQPKWEKNLLVSCLRFSSNTQTT